jgi:hypothetical protein
MTTFIEINDIWLDAGQIEVAKVALAVVERKASVDDLTQFIGQNTSVWIPAD